MPIIPKAAAALGQRSLVFTAPFRHSNFSLDTSGVAGVFGGEEAISAMATVHVYEHRKWLGWYNSPGSYEIAQRYGRLARVTTRVGVTIADLNHIPEHEHRPAQFRTLAPVYASVPIFISIGTCTASVLSGDWYASAMILLGILVSGYSCLVIGSGSLLFTHPKPAEASPPGDGVLASDQDIVILRGDEGAVNTITRGRFSLQFKSEPYYSNIGWCSVLLMVQFIAQLLLIPQANLFGQIMFVVSLAVSWAYNLWLSSFDKEAIQLRILKDNILRHPKLTKYMLGTRTSMAVFVLLVLQADVEEAGKIMDVLLPNDTKVWRKWKATVISRIKSEKGFEIDVPDWELPQFTAKEKELLNTLFNDARDAYHGFRRYQSTSQDLTHDTHKF
ncbi:hypothetical protein SCLCIDRAFT_10503 [Scleroderma citrinum Foug A]|uniref:Uncharacterized protein n=1 Tax=Scleroderma citrinum Foug A TaxID=1036808 RepID=A0A0C3D9E0_9AGAM|nr:hypothetical protein SCLCIDRAFT_10503 [Scleroderma citrinum Foug A]